LFQVLGFLSAIPLQVLGPLIDIAVLVLLLIIGLVIIIVLAKIFLFVLPAAIIAIVVWFLTGSIFWAGVAFLVIALISLVMRR
jgi:hypothetical protein